MHISLKQQAGMTLISWVFTLFLVTTVVWTGVTMVGITMEKMKIRSALDALQGQSFITRKDEKEILSLLMNNLDTNHMSNERMAYYKPLFKLQTQEGVLIVDIEFEIRKSFLWFTNYEIVGRFKETQKIVSN